MPDYIDKDSIVLYRYCDNSIEYETDEDLTNKTVYSSIRHTDGTLIAEFTTSVANTYFFYLTTSRETMDLTSPGTFNGDVKFVDNISGFEEKVLDLSIKIENAETRTPTP